DFLNTGPAVAATLRRQISQIGVINRVSNLAVTDLLVHDGEVVGAVALDIAEGEPVRIAAKAVIIATGGLTRIYQRNSASANMGGDGYALALAAGAALVDMEFVQFFPIGHLAPRVVGMDPIMCRLAKNGIDLARAPVEVAPIAHYHMGGIAVDPDMASSVPRLFAAGEAAGGANGANRLSGNAIPEALVFGEVAGRSATLLAAKRPMSALPSGAGADIVEQIRSLADGRKGDIAACELLDELREIMWRDVGPFRSAKVLSRAIVRTEEMRAALPKLSLPPGRRFNPALAEWFELRGSLIAASAVAHAAAARIE